LLVGAFAADALVVAPFAVEPLVAEPFAVEAALDFEVALLVEEDAVAAGFASPADDVRDVDLPTVVDFLAEAFAAPLPGVDLRAVVGAEFSEADSSAGADVGAGAAASTGPLEIRAPRPRPRPLLFSAMPSFPQGDASSVDEQCNDPMVVVARPDPGVGSGNHVHRGRGVKSDHVSRETAVRYGNGDRRRRPETRRHT